MSSYEIPYLRPVRATDQTPMGAALRAYGPICAEYMEGFEDVLRKPLVSDKDEAARCKAARMLITAAATGFQAKAYFDRQRANPFNTNGAFEADGNRLAAMTDFVTKLIHWSLDPYWRMLSPNFVSVQPIDRPSGYIFYAKDVAKDDAGRILTDRTLHDSSYSNRGTFSAPSEGTQVKRVGITLEKELVEVKYQALMSESSWEVERALESQFAINLEAIGAMLTDKELSREIDRQVMDDLFAFAGLNTRGYVFFDTTKGGTYDSLTTSEQQAWDKTFISRTISGVEMDMVADISRRPNFYVCGINVAKLLARTPDVYAADRGNVDFDQVPVKGSSIIQTGRMQATGSQVWVDPLLDTDSMIAGHTDPGDPFFTGYVMGMWGAAGILTPSWWDPDTLLHKQARGVAWYKKGVRAQQYRIVKLGNAS